MTIVYKILNPTTGVHDTANTAEECADKLATLAFNMLNNLTHGSPYSIVEIKEDGAQFWRNPRGEEIINVEEQLRKTALKFGRELASIPKTPVEILP